MAVGDMVNGMNTTGGAAYFSFQPAVSVSIMITFASPSYAVDGTIEMFNGTQNVIQEIVNTRAWNQFNIKMGINNTNYLRIWQNNVGAASSAGYSGIQLT